MRKLREIFFSYTQRFVGTYKLVFFWHIFVRVLGAISSFTVRFFILLLFDLVFEEFFFDFIYFTVLEEKVCFWSHIFFKFLASDVIAIPPFIFFQRVEGGSLFWVSAQKGVYKPFEWIGIKPFWFAFLMELPKFGEVSFSDMFVDSIVRASAEEGRAAIVHNEKNNSSSKHVCLDTFILSFFHFRRSIPFSAYSWSEFIIPLISFGVSG